MEAAIRLCSLLLSPRTRRVTSLGHVSRTRKLSYKDNRISPGSFSFIDVSVTSSENPNQYFDSRQNGSCEQDRIRAAEWRVEGLANCIWLVPIADLVVWLCYSVSTEPPDHLDQYKGANVLLQLEDLTL